MSSCVGDVAKWPCSVCTQFDVEEAVRLTGIDCGLPVDIQ